MLFLMVGLVVTFNLLALMYTKGSHIRTRLSEVGMDRLRHAMGLASEATGPITNDLNNYEVRMPIVYTQYDLENVTITPLKSPRIPWIIHQTWKDSVIPASYVEMVKSWRKTHPDWQYWYWTDAAAREFLRQKYPRFLPIFDGYSRNIHRADVIRYFILYEYGGWYADLDVEALKSLKNFTFSHNCILSHEPMLHTIFVWRRERLACNALMACRPRHPFMKRVIDKLPEYFISDKVKDPVIGKTGPVMLDNILSEYRSKVTNYTNADTVYLAPPDLFLPTMDPVQVQSIRKICSDNNKIKQWENKFKMKEGILNDLCVFMDAGDRYKNKPLSISFTDHHWMHGNGGNPKKAQHVYDIIDNIVNVHLMLTDKKRS
jgi:hypothetical protein